MGGIQTVKHVIANSTIGLERLKGYPELTVESLVLSGEWDDLFDETDRKNARKNLKDSK
jgi:hypothetical protein